MALYLYYGKIGDGKSHEVVMSEILPAVRDGRKIYVYMDGLNPRRCGQFAGRNANIVMWDNVDQVREAVQLEVDDREGVGLKIDRGSLIVVDEAQLVWDAREWQKTGKQSLAFMEYHRHFGLDVVLITQSPGRLDKGVVRLSNECLHVKNLRFLSSLAGNRYVVNVRQTPQDREPVATMRRKFEPNVFACYRSSTAVRGAKVHGRGVRGSMIWGPAAAALALILYVRSGGIGIFQGRAAEVTTGGVHNSKHFEMPNAAAERAKWDPPVSGITGDGRGSAGPVEAASAARPDQADDAVGQLGDEKRVVGVVEVNGSVQVWREGDSFLR